MVLIRNYPVVLGAGVAVSMFSLVAAVKAVEVKSDSSRVDSVYRVTVRMDDGSERTLSLAAAPAFAVGARVRVKGHVLERG